MEPTSGLWHSYSYFKCSKKDDRVALIQSVVSKVQMHERTNPHKVIIWSRPFIITRDPGK